MIRKRIKENGIRKKETIYKQCTCNNCSNQATKYLNVKLLRKIGYFCQSCAAELIEKGLADEVEERRNY
jgi:predicted SprT family Zn-dependent metalloprotease